MSKRMMSILSIFVVLAMVLGACGGGGEAPTATPAPAVLAADTPTPVPPTETPVPTEAPAATEAPVAESPATEAPAEEAPAVEADAVTAAVGEFAANIPDGWMITGKVDDVKAAIEAGAYVIDVREASEYAEGHIPGAVNIPLRTVAQSLDMVPTDQPVLVYCASGHRAGLATAALRELGYDNVKAFPNWKAWGEAGEEITTEATEAGSFTAKEVTPDLLAAVDAYLSSVPDGYYMVKTVEALEEAIANGAVLIDVREEAETAEGAIPGAINIPLRTLVANLDQIPQDKPVITYCATGYRSALANGILHTLGYGNVRSFSPGYGAWEAAQGEPSAEVPVEVAEAVVSDFEIVAAVDEWLSAVPEGYLAVGKLDAFKDAIENTNPLLIDVREESEYAEGHIPGAINIPLRTLTQNLDKVPADQPVFVYCGSGLRAGTALTSLGLLGYDNVKSFPPGWKGWSEGGEEVSTEVVEAVTVTPKEVNPEMLAAVEEFLINIPEGFYGLSTVEKVAEAIDAGALPIDVRETSEFDQGHIPGAPNIPFRTLAQSLDAIPTDQPVIVYCASGHRAAISNAALHIMGLDNVRSMMPGYGAWEAAGEPTE